MSDRIIKSQLSGKRKFLRDEPNDTDEQDEHFNEIDKLVLREQENEERQQQNQLSLPQWIRDSNNNSTADNTTTSIISPSFIGGSNSFISKDLDGLLVVKTDLQPDIPSSHKSTVYSKSNTSSPRLSSVSSSSASASTVFHSSSTPSLPTLSTTTTTTYITIFK